MPSLSARSLTGLPPRARGNPDAAGVDNSRSRFIPAHAGETASRSQPGITTNLGISPRLRENLTSAVLRTVVVGLSPRTREEHR